MKTQLSRQHCTANVTFWRFLILQRSADNDALTTTAQTKDGKHIVRKLHNNISHLIIFKAPKD